MSETLKRIPEAAHAFALLVLPVCGPSVRLRNTLIRVMHRSSVTEKPQAFGPFGRLPSLSRGAEIIAAAQHRPRRFSVLSSQPAPHALPYPIIKVAELAICPYGVSVVVPPSHDERIEVADDFGERASGGDAFHHDFDLVTQVVQLALRYEELADPMPRAERFCLHHPVAKEVEAFPDVGDPCLFHRQLHAKFRFQELRQRELFRFRLLSRAVNENDEVVRVAHHVERRLALLRSLALRAAAFILGSRGRMDHRP